MKNLPIDQILILLTAIYELIVRLIPTSKSLSIVGKVLEFAYKLSDFFDRKK